MAKQCILDILDILKIIINQKFNWELYFFENPLIKMAKIGVMLAH